MYYFKKAFLRNQSGAVGGAFARFLTLGMMAFSPREDQNLRGQEEDTKGLSKAYRSHCCSSQQSEVISLPPAKLLALRHGLGEEI